MFPSIAELGRAKSERHEVKDKLEELKSHRMTLDVMRPRNSAHTYVAAIRIRSLELLPHPWTVNDLHACMERIQLGGE
jgi:hypothetical protein